MRYIKTLNELKDLQKGTKFLEGAEKLRNEIEDILYILEDEGFECRVDIKEETYYVRGDGEKSYKLWVKIEPRFAKWLHEKIEDDFSKLLETDHYHEFVDRCKEVCKEFGYFFLSYKPDSMYRTDAVGIILKEGNGKSESNYKNTPVYIN